VNGSLPLHSGDLVLQVRNAPLPEVKMWGTRVCQTETWELWQDEAGRYVFLALEAPPLHGAIVDADFAAGEVFGDFLSNDGQGIYPLQSLDIRLFANWLANYGDVMLHASGVAVDGQGYCFVGASGAGKSTLAAVLTSTSRATVLGEDQVILRYQHGRFYIYGTPWHTDPAKCAPLGVPLSKLFLLDRTASPGVRPCAPLAGVARLLQTAFIPYYRPAAVSAIVDRLAFLVERVPFHILSYELGADALGLIEDA
jgi:hypothetical protein